MRNDHLKLWAVVAFMTAVTVVKSFIFLNSWHVWLNQTEQTSVKYPIDDDHIEASDEDSANETREVSGTGGSAFCLLIKDDNDILSEWIAYHYHTMMMRRLIVAVDPSSKTSPSDILNGYTREGSNGNFDLEVTVWAEDSFMPDYFRSDPQDYLKMPYTTLWQANVKKLPLKAKLRTLTADDINRADFTDEQRAVAHKINNHQIRQRYFYYKCMDLVKKEYGRNKIAHTVLIDTDEFLVPNPWVSSHVYENAPVDETYANSAEIISMFPRKPSAGSLLSYYDRFLDQSHRIINSAGIDQTPSSQGCVMAPRMLFGSKEDKDATVTTTGKSSTTTITWNHTKFESLRWRYHQDFNNGFKTFFENKPGSYPMKAIIDVHKHKLSPKEGFGVNVIPMTLPGPHYPSWRCPMPPENNFIENSLKYDQPLAIYHYLGSVERFLYRGDSRRDPLIYEAKNNISNYAPGDTNRPIDGITYREDDRWWIKGWFDSFLETHGAEAVYSVLGKDFATKQQHQA